MLIALTFGKCSDWVCQSVFHHVGSRPLFTTRWKKQVTFHNTLVLKHPSDNLYTRGKYQNIIHGPAEPNPEKFWCKSQNLKMKLSVLKLKAEIFRSRRLSQVEWFPVRAEDEERMHLMMHRFKNFISRINRNWKVWTVKWHSGNVPIKVGGHYHRAAGGEVQSHRDVPIWIKNRILL